MSLYHKGITEPVSEVREAAKNLAEGNLKVQLKYQSEDELGELADSYAMGLVDDNYTTYIQSTITSEQLSAMTGIVADKLALLELPQRAADTEGWWWTPPAAA